MLHGIIMAGGSGTRLWPESSPERPKQFLAFKDKTPLILATLNNLFGVVDFSRTLVVTGEKMLPLLQETLPMLRSENVLLEPASRNTAPCIGLVAVFLLQNDPDATMIVLPADHVIEPPTVFRNTLRFAVELLEESPEKLITLGVPPTFAATSYGYIEAAEKWKTPAHQDASVHTVAQFHEKPDQETAQKFVDSGNFRWNTGIFIWKAKLILELISQFQPQLGERLKIIAEAIKEKKADFPTILREEFEAMESISIDYAVLEHASNMICIDAPFSWDDVGTWRALDRLNRGKHDKNGNLEDHCRLITLNSANNIVRCDDADHVIALLGVENLIVVQTRQGTLIANKNHEENVRDIVKKIKESS